VPTESVVLWELYRRMKNFFEKMHVENCECSSQIIKIKLLNVLKDKSEKGIGSNLSIITSSTKQ
jgi:hypothetical protein